MIWKHYNADKTLLIPLFNPPETFIPACGATPDFLHAAMRPDMITETEVEISTEDCCEEEDEEMITLLEDPEPERDHEPVRKRKGRQRYSQSMYYERKSLWNFKLLQLLSCSQRHIVSRKLWKKEKN